MGAHPARSDLMVSLGFAALALVEIVLTPPLGLTVPERVGESVGAVLIAGCFAFRRRTLVLSAVLARSARVGPRSGLDQSSRLWEIAAVMLACYSCARHSTRSGSWVAPAAATGYALLASSLEESDGVWMFIGNFLFFLGLMVAIPWTAGRALRRRQAAEPVRRRAGGRGRACAHRPRAARRRRPRPRHDRRPGRGRASAAGPGRTGVDARDTRR